MDSFVTKTKRVRLEVVQGEQGTVSTSESAEGSVVDAAGGVEAAGAGVEAGTAPHHRKSGWNPDWLKDPLFNTWLYNTKNGMFCRLCRLHKPPHTKGPRQRSFIEAGYTVYRKDVIQHHLKSELHQYSVGKQASLASGLSVVQAFEPNIVMEHEAIIGGFKCLYWLMKNEISHHNNYPKLLSLAQLLGCSYFAKLKLDQRSNYHSHRIVDEMLQILAKIVEYWLVLKPYLSGLESNLKNRFPDVELLGAFVVLSPRAAMADEDTNIENLDILARKLIPGREEDLKTELYSFKPHLTGAFKDNNGPESEHFPYQKALERFFDKPRWIHCSNRLCRLCNH
ncbi:hypothetical protein JOQ06_020274 [Pogonophryne albipinna]|uniref:TTF-type domain-containing protein n=1 Tax=Pogonophryne albipinna TaxID=1090488 RepID=A0AAD6BU63_9TELE|nr:hypothetical protein JOQ06_020274 [Pogonophryne albipinna]